MRKLFAVLLCAVLLFTLPLPSSAAETRSAPFTDLDGNYAGEEILFLYNQGIYANLELEAEPQFSPQAAITRGEFVVAVLNASGFGGTERRAHGSVSFADMSSAPAAMRPYLAEGYVRGILRGALTDGVLYSRWDSPITREEAATVLGRVLNLMLDADVPSTDGASISDWARDYVSAMYAHRYLTGYPDGTFAPRRNISRADASHLIYNLFTSGALVPNELRIYAGMSVMGYKSGARLESAFCSPQGIALLDGGKLLVADREANLLRMISADGVSTYAGSENLLDDTGMPRAGYRDAEKATDAVLSAPRYITRAANGDIFFTEGGNNTVRMIVAATGRCYTFSGSGEAGYAEGARDAAKFDLPSGIAISGNTVYIADTLNNCIRVIDAAGNTSLYAGNPGANGGYSDGSLRDALFCEPTDIQFGPDGALYVLDSGNSMIRRISSGSVTTVAGAATERDAETGAMLGGCLDGQVETALFRAPMGLFITSTGTIYVADTGNDIIRKIENGYVSTIAGNGVASHSTGPALLSSLNRPLDVVYYGGKLYITDSYNNCVKILTAREVQ